MSKRKRDDEIETIKTNFNKIFDSDSYNIMVSKQSSKFIVLIYSKNSEKFCGNLAYDENKGELFVNLIEKCSLTGTDFLSKLDEIALLFKLKNISLEDKSNIIIICDGKKVKINLALLNILSTGKSWYNSKGYLSANFYNEETNNSKILNLTMHELLHRPKRKMRQTFYKKIKILLFSFLIV